MGIELIITEEMKTITKSLLGSPTRHRDSCQPLRRGEAAGGAGWFYSPSAWPMAIQHGSSILRPARCNLTLRTKRQYACHGHPEIPLQPKRQNKQQRAEPKKKTTHCTRHSTQPTASSVSTNEASLGRFPDTRGLGSSLWAVETKLVKCGFSIFCKSTCTNWIVMAQITFDNSFNSSFVLNDLALRGLASNWENKINIH